MTALPLTMWLQIAVSSVGAAIGALALAVARRAASAPRIHRVTWRLAGAAFLLMAVSALVQNAFGSAALAAGAGTPVWERYLRWAPPFNYSRNAIEAAFLVLLLVLVRRPGARLEAGAGAWILLALAGLAGFALGALEGPLVSERHFRAIAVMDTAVFALWALALGVAMIADILDRLLLLALALNAAQLPLNALWFGWLARLDSGGWTPRPADMQAYRLALHVAVLLVVAHRARLARRGVRVPGLAALR